MRFAPPDVPSAFLVHEVFFSEHAGFHAPYRERMQSYDGSFRHLECLRVQRVRNALSVVYQYNLSQGAPERYSAPITALTLEPEQWGRICYNGRFSGDDYDWFYKKWIWNIGLFAVPTPKVFLHSPPVRVFSQMAHLF